MTTNFKEMGLNYSGKYSEYAKLSVENWNKFFPVINVQAKQPLIFIATKYWYAEVMYSSIKNDFLFLVRIDGLESRYCIVHKTGSRFDAVPRQRFIKFLCPYDKKDIRRYVWINTLKQYDYAKICGDTQDVLINLLLGEK